MKHRPIPEPYFLLLTALISALNLQAADTARWKLSCYGETYFQQEGGESLRPGFLYSHHRNGAAATNLAILQAQRVTNRLGLYMGVMDGTYARTNLAAEPRILRHLFEARIAWKPSAKGRSWLEAGVFPSHIGNESAIGMQCPTVTRSLMADNSPYYESGIRWLQKSKNEKREGGLYLLNGWQRMRLPGRGVWPAAGHQLIVRLQPGLRVNSSSFVGNPGDRPGVFRMFHDAWLAWDFKPRWTLHAAYDIGWQRRAGTWQTGSLVLQHRLPRYWVFSGRAETFVDPGGIMVPAQSVRGSRVNGLSINADYQATASVMWRLECRWLQSPYPLRETGGNQAMSINTTLCFLLP